MLWPQVWIVERVMMISKLGTLIKDTLLGSCHVYYREELGGWEILIHVREKNLNLLPSRNVPKSATFPLVTREKVQPPCKV